MIAQYLIYFSIIFLSQVTFTLAQSGGSGCYSLCPETDLLGFSLGVHSLTGNTLCEYISRRQIKTL